jgi:large subunit ribosomal protein L3
MSKSKRLGLMATKVGMTQLFMDDGLRVAVTVMKVEPNVVVQKKTMENDGYSAVQLGSNAMREKLVNKAMAGHFKKANVSPFRHLTETCLDPEAAAKLNVGDALTIALLKDCKSLDVTGTSKGKGTAGVMKRHHMKGFRATHGTHEYFRHGGSIGCRATPGKVHPGKRMPGRMGNETVTTLNVMVLKVDEEKGLVFLRGAVPGPRNGLVELIPSTRAVQKGQRMTQESQIASKNPMKASKAGGAAKPAKK